MRTLVSTRKQRIFRFFLVILILSFVGAGGVTAKEEEDVDLREENDALSSQSILDRYHSYLREKFHGPVVWFDDFFGDPRLEFEELPASFVRLRVVARYTEGEGFDFPLRLRANVKMPRFTRRFRLIVVGENEDDIAETQKDKADNPGLDLQPNDNRTNLGLRYLVYKNLRSRFHFGGGVSLHTPVESYVRMYYRRLAHIGKNNVIKLTETVFWNTRHGFGETSRIDMERVLLEDLTGRVSLFGTYAEDSNGLDWGGEVNLFRQLTGKSAVAFDFGAYGETRPEKRMTNYRVASRYRRNFYRPWLFFELEPGVNFPLVAEQGREAVGYLSVVFEIQFLS
ncbi:MAG: hypothetical protein KKG47_11885 [Proteobacteria bacterium]|nr:hypothetical protein [Pseudomonadota bacterium]MBU1737821.1 hypothetical protein [Pseudomonadota bacterium]